MRKMALIALIVLLGVVIPAGYFNLIRSILPRPQSAFSIVWQDTTFSTESQNPAWVSSNLSDGWIVKWAPRQVTGSSGLSVSPEGFGDLYATFRGYDTPDERGVGGIMIEKLVGAVNTEVFPYLVIEHRETSADPSLMLSLGVVDENGTYLYEKGSHTTLAWERTSYDLRKLYNGTVNAVTIVFTNDFDPYYTGGTQHAYIRKIGMYEEKAAWGITYNRESINATLSSDQGNLRSYGSGNLTSGTIVSAQHLFEPTIELEGARYLKAMIKTSGIDVAARITAWTDNVGSTLILLKTYNDSEWHTEIVDLWYFGLSNSKLQMLELGWQQVYNSTGSSTVWYSQLTLNQME